MSDNRPNTNHLGTNLKLLLWLPLLLFSILLAQQPATTIAVLEFEAAGVEAPAVQTLANVVRKELIKSKLFRVVERNLMDDILSEQGLQQSGCTTTECVVEVGRLLGVQKILSGSISKLGELFIIDLQITDITTGEIEVLESIDYVGKLEELPRLIRELTNRITTDSIAQEKETVLYVTSNPVGAKVYLDENFSGNTPLKLNTDLENIDVRVSQTGYSNWTQFISINQNETNIVEANLVSVAGTNNSLGLGQITIKCDHSDLEIYIDGGLASKTPMT
ncbi:MAG: PEGA domain-containing protein, partial [Candidatus Marinimicrobia bacterium]|nr:PEGA domain-containing protein [Candidatus Neomarinimicrobiota bacterium]